jgi:hypothetical protein
MDTLLKRFATSLGLTVVITSMAWGATTNAKETSAKESDRIEDFDGLPKAMRKELAKDFPGGVVTDWHKETRNGVVKYNVTLLDENKVEHTLVLDEKVNVIGQIDDGHSVNKTR